jgi:hypothetical protein
MPYVYEGDQPTRVEGKRYAPGNVTEDESVKGKDGFREVKDDEAKDIRSKSAGNFADTSPDAWEEAYSEKARWMGQAGVAAPLNKVIGDNEAPFGPPTGTITTKQAVMREASSSAERLAFGDHEWLPEDEDKLKESTSGQVQAAQARESGSLEEVTDELIGSQAQGEESGGEGKSSQSGQKSRGRQSSSE